uniref:Uncharacterized protein n=1 Tax=Octopus bimaculoides TaxID=37653 RepID=A0A0L8HE36_OCTBM
MSGCHFGLCPPHIQKVFTSSKVNGFQETKKNETVFLQNESTEKGKLKLFRVIIVVGSSKYLNFLINMSKDGY